MLFLYGLFFTFLENALIFIFRPLSGMCFAETISSNVLDLLCYVLVLPGIGAPATGGYSVLAKVDHQPL